MNPDGDVTVHRMTKDKRQKANDKSQKTKGKSQKANDKRQMTKVKFDGFVKSPGSVILSDNEESLIPLRIILWRFFTSFKNDIFFPSE